MENLEYCSNCNSNEIFLSNGDCSYCGKKGVYLTQMHVEETKIKCSMEDEIKELNKRIDKLFEVLKPKED